MKRFTLLLVITLASATTISIAQNPAQFPRGFAIPEDQLTFDTISVGDFAFDYSTHGGVSRLRNPNDPFGAIVTTPPPAPGRGGGAAAATAQNRGARPEGAPLQLSVAYKVAAGDSWIDADAGGNLRAAFVAERTPSSVRYANFGGNAQPALGVVQTFRTDGKAFDWDVDLTAGKAPVTVGDLGISIPVQGPTGENPAQIFERGFLKHQFISGAGSFFFYTRASGAPPFLLVTTKPGTKLEYFTTTGRSGGTMFVHSAKSGAAETRGTWRQAHTSLTLKPGTKHSYGFRMQWANSYDELRDLLYQNGLFDVRVAPGMTVPTDLSAKFALRTKAKIESITAEHAGSTTIASVSQNGDTRVYEATFKKLGENMLTITHDGGRKTYLEFFVTEPMETLIKKRAAFLVNRQQVKDPSKWWNGVYAIYDMKAKKVRTIDDPDIFVDRMVYALTCDDPGLAKAPYLAAKNVSYPDKKEIESLEYYIKNFVWGGLQRRDDELPYPYGVYGTPNWFVNRDPQRRIDYANKLANGATAKKDLIKEHVWRNYDYPHVIMLYFHMYQIAKMYPEMSTYLDARGYLTRAMETAKAFYTYPYEIYPEYYDTYKWGLYNELIVLDLIDAMKGEGFGEQAKKLTTEWEKKTKYFVYDDAYPFRSEYAFDRTAFESTYALAKYGATHDMQPDENLWFDLKLKKWWSHPSVKREDSRAFMDRQLASGLVVRGWLNPAYYTLGADPGVSYMAAMGGWGVLDYALNFAPNPYDWLQLGYASYLSSWSLVNSGTAESGYGYWFPGKENDGAAGWQFTSAKAASAWMGGSVPGGVTEPRGPWHYDGEIDLGFGGALRMAATVVTKDPTFGWLAYGGTIKDTVIQDFDRTNSVSVNPRDGLRRRLDIVLQDRALPFSDSLSRFKLELERDGFDAKSDIIIDKALKTISFTLENRTGSAHATGMRLSLPVNSRYAVTIGGKAAPLVATGNPDYPWRVEIGVDGVAVKVEIKTYLKAG